jgi:hypothetical protein
MLLNYVLGVGVVVAVTGDEEPNWAGASDVEYLGLVPDSSSQAVLLAPPERYAPGALDAVAETPSPPQADYAHPEDGGP